MKLGPVVFIAAVLAISAVGLLFHKPHADVSSQIDIRDPTKVAQGKKLYGEICAACHGAHLEGETPNWRQRRPDGSLPAPPHNGTGHTADHTDERLFEITKFGRLKEICLPGPSNMPKFDKILSDKEVWAVLSFIKSTWPPDVRRHHDEVNRDSH